MSTNQNPESRFPHPKRQMMSNANNKISLSDPRHKVLMSDAFDFIYQFINCYQETGISNIGGYIDIDELKTKILPPEVKLEEIIEGPLFWHCFNPYGGSFPQYFLAWSYDDEFDSNNPPEEPNSTLKYYISSVIHSYTSVLSPGTLLSYLKTFPHSGKPKLTEIPPELVKLFSDCFRNDFPLAINGFDYRPYSKCGLFIKEEIGIWDLIRQQAGIKGINYYFGINTKQAMPTICVVLIAVDKYGKNIFDDKALILERSHP